MTAPTPVGFLDFFILEASDYVQQLDGLLDAGGASGPDPDGLQRVARALRGSATMAKLLAFAEVAAGVERVGRGLREGALRWDAELSAIVVAAVDDCKLLLRNVRTWSEADDTRARARASELTQRAPVRPATPIASPNMQGHDSYLATEASNIGAGLELLATRPSDRDAATNVLRRVRALRGIASVKDHAALADVLEAAEQAAHPLEIGEPTLSAERIALLSAAATVLRGVASAIRGGGSEAPAADVARFAVALDALQERETGTERIVPIADLFYDDGGATIVNAAAHPPTTPPERFRLEAVGQGEHLRRLVSDARSANDALARERVRRGLRQALRSLRQTADSFGEKEVADLVASNEGAVVELDARALDALDDVATLLSQPGSTLPGSITERLRAMRAPRTPVMTPIRSSAAVPQPTEAPQERVIPAVAELAAAVLTTAVSQGSSAAARLGELLDNGIKSLGALARTPLSAPAAIAEQPPVPIGVLLYRGRAAVLRCVEIRDQAKGSGGTIDADALNELYDLLDLALTD
jgi:chemotaxis protein histidine kinase CheA